MNLTRASLANPYGVMALTLVIVAMGVFAFFRTPTDLFPDSAPPQVAVITVEPGASANDLADKVTQIIEKELNSITGLKRIRSTSRDEVSSVVPEFLYTKSIGEAVTDVQNAVARVRARLPQDILEPMIYRITDATRPLLTLALSPKEGSPKSLAEIRLLAENPITDALLRVPGVGDIDIFGAHQPEVQIRVDRDKLAAFGTTLGQVLAQIQQQNVAAPAGILYTQDGEYLVRVQGEFRNLDQMRELPIARSASGRVLLRDVATVQLSAQEPRSGYLGNGREAIAVNVMRPEGGETVSAIRRVKQELQNLQARYPDVLFDIANDQQPIIDVNVQGMRSSVYQAIFLTVLVVLLFLADLRAALAVSLGIPLSFLAALTALWFSPYTLNMVTLSGLVIAVGLVLDAAIVMLENVYRHYKTMNHPDAVTATLEGAQEVTHGILGGMLTTVIVLVPVMFAGGYTQQTMRPLNMMISVTIIASLVISLTVIPLVASRLIARPRGSVTGAVRRALNPFGRWVDRRGEDMTQIARVLLRHRGWTILAALAFFVFTMRVVAPLNGKELMPAMDTGIGVINFDTPTLYTPQQVQETARQVEAMIRDTSEGLKWISTTIGSEPGQISFGGGGATAQSVNMLVTLVDRKHRQASIWEMEKRWREGMPRVAGVRTFDVTEYGATPLSTTKAPMDLVISGPDVRVLDRLANEVLARLRGVQGLTDVRRSWYIDKPEQNLVVDPDLAKLYELSPQSVAQMLKANVKGVPASQMRLEGALDIPIRIQYRADQIDTTADLEDALLPSPMGTIPLRAVAALSTVQAPPFITREALHNTIDITGINSGRTIGDVGKQIAGKLMGLKLPADYNITMSGTLDDLKTGNAEMGHALIIGIVLLYILLVWMFKSFAHPITIMSSVLFSIAAAMWGLLLFHKPMCKPAMMGIILLAGTVVNNVILILDFINERRAKGMPRDEAILEAVRLRFRPILMTALSASIGLSPLVFEMAVGMERLSPLGIVAAVGLLAGVLISTLLIPVVYSLMDSAGSVFHRKPKLSRGAVAGLLLAACMALVSPRAALAAESDEPVTMTLQEAVDYALEHSPALHAAQADAAIAQGQASSVRSGLLPQLNLFGTAAYSDLDQPVLPGLPPAEVRFSDTLYSGGIRIDQLLLDFGQSWNRMQAARHEETAAQDSSGRRQEEVAFRVCAGVHQRLLLDDVLRAAQASEASLQTLVSNIHARVLNGKAARLEELKSKVRLAGVQSQIATIEARRVTAQNTLLSVMGYEGPPVRWIAPDSDPPSPLPETETLLEEALDNRIDFQAQRAHVEAAQSGLLATQRSRFPRIGLFGQYAQYGADQPQPATPAGNTSDGWEDNYMVGVAVSLPLFDSGLRSGQITAARAKQAKAEAGREALRLQIQTEVASAVAEMESARIRVSALQEAAQEAQQALDDEHTKYDAGKSTINDVLDAEAVRLTADSQYSQAQHEAAIARLNVQLATGLWAE